MSFWPDNSFAYAYVAALGALVAFVCLFVGYFLDTKHKDVFQSMALLVALWLMTRIIRVFDADNFMLWLASDILVIAGVCCIRSKPALACAVLYFLSLLFDSYTLIWGGSFDGAAAVNEAVGYISMLIIAGAAYDWNLMGRASGVRHKTMGHIVRMGNLGIGFIRWIQDISRWGTAKRCPGRTGQDMEDAQDYSETRFGGLK